MSLKVVKTLLTREVLLPRGSGLSLGIHGSLITAIGADLLGEGPSNFSTKVWDPIKVIMPVHYWGLLLFVLGLCCLVTAIKGEKRLAQLSLAASGAVTIFFAGCWLQSGLTHTSSSVTAILLAGLTVRAFHQLYIIERYKESAWVTSVVEVSDSPD